MGTIRRVIKGTSKHTAKNISMWATEGSISFNAAKKVNLHGEEGGVVLGDYVALTRHEEEIKKIINIYWTYGDDFTPLSSQSRFYVDMNLHIKTKNYKKGETIKITVKNEDDSFITENLQELVLNGVINEDNNIVFKNVLKDYALNLVKEEE